MWARIENGLVVETTDVDPAGRYPEVLVWAPVPPEWQPWIKLEYSFVDGAFDAPILDLINGMKALVRVRRDAECDRGVVDGGVRWHGDKASYGDISNAIHAAELYEARTGQSWQARWKPVGGYVTVDLPAMQDALLAVGAFILAVYGREDAIIQLLEEAASAAEMIAIYNDNIDTGWPE